MGNGEMGVNQVGSDPVVGRLAPSPTGRMHLGIFCLSGGFVGRQVAWASGLLRLCIEDTDGPSAVKDADRWIMDDLDWLGLDWYGPVVYQSQRNDLYVRALKLLEMQHLGDGQPLVYPCFCSRADIRAASAPNAGDGFMVYPGTCRGLSGKVVRE